MKLTIFQSDKGDCLLLEAQSGQLVLCDGGMGPSMRQHVRAELAALRKQGRDLDYAYISHIDNDHISGVLQLLEDEIEWRVFDHHSSRGTPIREPSVPRPPKIKGILHNGFRDQIGVNQKPIDSLFAARAIENLLGTMASSLYASAVPELIDAAEEMQAIATGVPEAIRVSKLIAADALDIPLNKPPGVKGRAKLLYAGRPGAEFHLGSMKFTLLGPTENELEDLRNGWINWLRANKERLRKLRTELKRRVDDFSNGALTESPFDLSEWEGIPGYKGVSVPNVASLMFLVKGNGRRLLLTGDGQQDRILEGLARTGFLTSGHIHVDVLKVQHHGSEHNMDANFARTVSADHYVFCGNGEHANPDLRVLNLIYNARLGKTAVRALSPEAKNRAFHFWFSTTADAQTPKTKKREYYRRVEQRAAQLAARSKGQLQVHFNAGTALELLV